MNISKLKKQEMIDILQSAFGIDELNLIYLPIEDLRYIMSYYKKGYTIKETHKCTKEEGKIKGVEPLIYIGCSPKFLAIPTNNKKPTELKEFCLEVELNVKGNFYVKAPTLEKAKEFIQKQNFLNDELTNKFMTTEYKKYIVEENKLEIK
jgi:hypothetical protein